MFRIERIGNNAIRHNGSEEHSGGSKKTNNVIWYYRLRKMKEFRIPKAVTEWEREGRR